MNFVEWVLACVVLFFIIYFAVRLALKHDRDSQIADPHDVADRELRERLRRERGGE
ncbi:hypothetical protein OIE66_40000 [Nonomuraea sp. NBC_01738]|uniref:hypothetical protein n=1 Tax=Nonomuraea sp. NBC_01738 TaxID=2976003 RepID=UPI002E14BA6D|nr:hypothetical protein OIE66_40000 [Nonomuraea sp. NBC_01738]